MFFSWQSGFDVKKNESQTVSGVLCCKIIRYAMFVICLDWLLPINSIVPPSDGNKVLGRTALNRQFTCTFILRHAHATHHCTASWALTSRSHPYLQKRRRLFSSTLRHSHEYFLLGSEVSCDAPTFLWHSIACQRQTIWLCILLIFSDSKNSENYL